MKNIFEELAGAEPAAEEKPIEEVTETPVEEVVEEPTQEAPETEVAPEPEVKPAEPNHGLVPLTVLLEEREKRQRYEQQVREFERQKQEAEKQRSIPSFDEDPLGHLNRQYQEMIQAQAETQKVNDLVMGYELAKVRLGEEKTNVIRDWAAQKAQSDPRFAMELDSIPQGRFNYVIQEYEKDNMLQAFATPESKRAYIEQQAKELGILSQAPIAPAIAPKATPELPAASISNAPSSTVKAKSGDEIDEFDFLNKKNKR